MTFAAPGWHCVGFDHGVGNRNDKWSMGSGYGHLVQGYFCEKQLIEKPEERVRQFLSALRIGPASTGRSALGTAVVPLP